MEEIYACIAYEPCLFNFMDFKKVTDPPYILGREYNIHERDGLRDLNEDIKSRLWFTYRKQFEAIGDTSLTSDSGWGCMHRCGQMLLSQTFLLHHFGRDWRWKPGCDDETYKTILNKFDDRVECPYSIHKIASMGSILQKQIGHWFGPNTVVQVLKRLVEEDSDRAFSIHVAMDNMIIKSEIRRLFRKRSKYLETGSIENSTSASSSQSDNESESPTENELVSSDNHSPVLLTIPLRLGLSDIIPVYFEKLKASFKMKQTLGIIGGRINHASYFIGYAGNELIFLDPHTTQLHRSESSMEDETYHCEHPGRMKFSELDPSIALCFYLEDEDDFEHWCQEAQKLLLEPEKDAVFEILNDKPPMLPYVDIDDCDDLYASLNDNRIYTSDDEFELLM